MSKTSVAASSSTLVAAQATTLALALVVALELGGAYALSQGPGVSQAVAAEDTAAPAQPRVASVEISIVAQADMPAR